MQSRPAGQPPAPDDDWWWIFDPRFSLRARAALIIGGGAVLFTVFVAWLGGVVLHRQLQANLGFTFETLSAQVADKIDRVIYQHYRDLQFVATLPPFMRPEADPAERRRVLDALQLAARDFAWIGFADPAGHVVSATRGMLEGTVVEQRPWFRQGREGAFAASLHEMTLPPGDKGGAAGRMRVLDLAVPVTGSHGQFLGVLGAHVSWAWASEVQLSVIPESAQRERLGVTLYAANNEVLLDSGGSGWSLPPDAPVVRGATRFRGTMIEDTSLGTQYLTGYVRSRGYRDYRGLGWLITVRQPVDHAFAPVQELRRTLVKWGLLFGGALMVTSWVGATHLIRQLRRIAAAARRIRHGDVFAVMPRPKGERDLERMCAEVGDLVQELRPPDQPRPEPPPDATAAGDPASRPSGTDPRRVLW
jgi:HAMP domain-containing protein